jgi:hypothetical protein
MCEVGDSFILQNDFGDHLHVIVAEASTQKNSQVMLVYLTSAVSYRDNTTIVKYGEHPFVTKKNDISWIKYQNIMIYSRQELTKLVVKQFGKVDEDLLKRIHDGIENSEFVEKGIRRLFREWKLDRTTRSLK